MSSHPLPPYKMLDKQYSPPRSSPLRNSSIASNGSSVYSATSNPFPPSRTSTISSAASSGSHYMVAGHKRGISEAGMSPLKATFQENLDDNPGATYKSLRQSLRPLPQQPVARLLPDHQISSSSAALQHEDSSHGLAIGEKLHISSKSTTAASQPKNPHSFGLSRSDSRAASSNGPGSTRPHGMGKLQDALFTKPDLTDMQKSSTGHLRTLSKLAQDSVSDDFSIAVPTPLVAGLQGRRQLKRTDSIKGSRKVALSSESGYSWGSRNWMDQQRQFLQAYEYLCHIGEAKEWIEDVMNKPIPPIVQLEEALRDGVILAEVVQTLKADSKSKIKIFRHPKLQFRHSDNIAVFFNYLAEIALPDLFRFELIDLYDKKNIPKVIYCIHALSWLLYRLGIVTFRIGNLVGQLQFEHHELEEVQKGLDKAGVNMPSFSAVGASFGVEPEPLPVESEEERIERELSNHHETITDLQAQLRGCLLRLRLGAQMQGLWDAEELITRLQSRVRGDFQRQISRYHLSMKVCAIKLQSATRGFLVRNGQLSSEAKLQSQEPQLVLLQGIARARRVREAHRLENRCVRQEESGIRQLQAAVRGALARNHVDNQYEEAHQAQDSLSNLQATMRGHLYRRGQARRAQLLLDSERSIQTIQAAIRGGRSRSIQALQMHILQSKSRLWQAVQASARAQLLRSRVRKDQKDLCTHGEALTSLQSLVRSKASREHVARLNASLQLHVDSILDLQSAVRGFSMRSRNARDAVDLQKHALLTSRLQGLMRGRLSRQRQSLLLTTISSHSLPIIHLQALARAMLLRLDVGSLLSRLEEEEAMVEELQAAARACLVRASFAEKMRFFKENMAKVVKVQSFVRGKLQGQAYKSLTCGTNPPVGTVKNFVHLLNDSDFDFDEEVEFERLRKTVVQHVRQNEMADQYIAQLDIKIALLVKNKITLDEVVKHQKHFGGSVGSLLQTDLAPTDSFDLKALNKYSRRKLEQYQDLFCILQTQSHYLAHLFTRIREAATAEKECERIKHLVMGLFGYAQKRREEFFLLKVIARAIGEEVDRCHSLQDHLRGSFFWSKVFGTYAKSPKDRKFLRDILGPVVKDHVVNDTDLDLESDPLQIYHTSIDHEQLRTGQRSQRPRNINPRDAITDPETKKMFISHLVDLRELVDLVFSSMTEFVHRMPYGIRYTAQQMFHSLSAKFPREEQTSLLQIVGHWLWKSYLQPALLEPNKFGVIDQALSSEQKKNLGEISRVLSQIASGRLFGTDGYLHPLNTYVSESMARLASIWATVIDVPDAESHFDIDAFNDLYAKTKPTLYIKLADIFSIHQLVSTNLAYLCPNQDDVLHVLVQQLGSAKTNENEMMSVGSSEICLTLNPKLHEIEDPDAEIKAHLMETKRCILYIIRVQSGANLMEIMIRPIAHEDEDRWRGLVRDELAIGTRKRGAYAEANTLIDIASMSYAELKATALENILRLERHGRITRRNNYQDLLNAIAVDIRTKHKRRIQRQRELEGVRLTLDRLNEQAQHLEMQLKTYNDYIEQAMVTLQNKKGKKRFLMPFTKQWEHERELQRSGRVPKFGSFKYSAMELAHRGILISWHGYAERQWAQLDLTISSNEVGIFTIEGSSGSITVPGASAEVSLDDLLQAQYNGTPHLEFFDSQQPLRVRVKQFVHLIMRKFYQDKDS